MGAQILKKVLQTRLPIARGDHVPTQGSYKSSA